MTIANEPIKLGLRNIVSRRITILGPNEKNLKGRLGRVTLKMLSKCTCNCNSFNGVSVEKDYTASIDSMVRD